MTSHVTCQDTYRMSIIGLFLRLVGEFLLSRSSVIPLVLTIPVLVVVIVPAFLFVLAYVFVLVFSVWCLCFAAF